MFATCLWMNSRCSMQECIWTFGWNLASSYFSFFIDQKKRSFDADPFTWRTLRAWLLVGLGDAFGDVVSPLSRKPTPCPPSSASKTTSELKESLATKATKGDETEEVGESVGEEEKDAPKDESQEILMATPNQEVQEVFQLQKVVGVGVDVGVGVPWNALHLQPQTFDLQAASSGNSTTRSTPSRGGEWGWLCGYWWWWCGYRRPK